MTIFSVQPDIAKLITPDPKETPELSDIQLPVNKIHRLLAYVENLGLDPIEIAGRVGLDIEEILNSTPDDSIPSLYYALLYKETVVQLQKNSKLVPWAAGIGSEAFRLMCYCIIGCKTLRDALQRAQRFDALLFPIIGHRIELHTGEAGIARLVYVIDKSSKHDAFAPANWTLDECESVANSSGLETWFGLCGWLIGRSIEAKNASINGVSLSESYSRRMQDLFQCPVKFNADETSIDFPEDVLDYRIVHDNRSLEEFLDTGPHQLWSTDIRVVSTSAAIKSLLGTDFRHGVPTFEEMASNMHMSSSSLRRHLLAEGTSYQKIKDECRREIAIELLCFDDSKISDISEHVGFADTSSFVRSFRTWTGMTPKAYREHARPLLLPKRR